jgi:LysM repeat protein
MSLPVEATDTRIHQDPPPQPPAPAPPPPDRQTTHVVAKGENLSELSARYKVPQQDILSANPQIGNPSELNEGQTLAIPLDKTGGATPTAYSLQKGETLTDVAARNGVSVEELSRANNIANPDMVYPGESIWIPPATLTAGSVVKPLSAGADAPPWKRVDAAVRRVDAAQNDPGALAAARTDLKNAVDAEIAARAGPHARSPMVMQTGHDIAARYANDAQGRRAVTDAVNELRADRAASDKTDDAVKMVTSAQQALNATGGKDPVLKATLDEAKGKLHTALADEIAHRIGGTGDDATVAATGQQIAARYAKDPAAQLQIKDALTQVRSDRQAQAIVAQAQTQTDPGNALQALNDGYSQASQPVKDALLHNAGAAAIVDNAAAWANQPLQQKPDNATMPQGQTAAAMRRLDDVTRNIDPALAGRLVDRAVSGYEKFASDHRDELPGSPFGMEGMTQLMNISGRIAGTKDGADAISRFAAMDGWNADAVRSTIAGGTNPAYAVELARQMSAHGDDPAIVLQTINEGVQQLRSKVDGDVTALAEHNRELNWLTQNLGKTMTPQELQNAVQRYESKDGGKWKADDDKMIRQLTGDGAALTQDLKALAALSRDNPGAAQKAGLGDTIRTAFNDPSVAYGMQLASGSNPALVSDADGKALLDTASALKLSDQGRKSLQIMGTVYIRSELMSRLNGLAPSDPAYLTKAQAAIEELKNRSFANWMLGANEQTTWNKAVDAVSRSALPPGASIDDLENSAKGLNDDLNNIRALGSATVPGQLLRTIGVASNVASLYGSGGKFTDAMKSQNSQAAAFYGIESVVNAAGLTQKVSELGVGTGLISGPSEGTAAKLFGAFASSTGSGAYNLTSGVFQLVDGIRSATGAFGGTQDGVAASLSFVTGGGGALYGLSQLGVGGAAASTLGLVGVGLVAAGTVAKLVYDEHKAAHQYEGAAQSFLQAGGYSSDAASALSKQDGLLTGATGASGVPFLARYATMKHLTSTQLQAWVNGLTHDQLSALDQRLLQTAGDAHGDPGQFTDGPPQTTFITDPSSGWSTPITLTNTLHVFEDNLRYDHVPLPVP